MKEMKKISNRLVCFATVLLMCIAIAGTACAGIDKADAVRYSVVRVYNVGLGWGTGICVGKEGEPVQYVLTNWHVIENAQEVRVVLDNKNASNNIKCSILGSWQYPDMALLKMEVPTTLRKPVKFRSTYSLSNLERVYSVGFPGLADAKDDGSLRPSLPTDATLTEGRVNNTLYLSDGCKLIQTTGAEITHGNSGGPIVDDNGYVVAQSCWGFNEVNPDGNWETAYSYAVPTYIDYALNAMDEFSISYEMAPSSLHTSLPYVSIAMAVVLLALGVLLIVKQSGRSAVKVAVGTAASTTVPSAAPAARGAELVVLSGALAGKRYTVQGSISIGRDASRCGIVYPANTEGISGLHCRVQEAAGQYTVTDLCSSYGTFVNGEKLTPNVAHALSIGGSFTLGSKRNEISLQ